MLEIKWVRTESTNTNSCRGIQECLVPYANIGGTYLKIENTELWDNSFDLKSKVYVGNEEFPASVTYEAETVSAAADLFYEIVKDLRLYVNVSNHAHRVYIDSNLCTIDHDIIGWKKCFLADGTKCLVELLIQKGTYCNLTVAKCRSEYAKVLGIYSMWQERLPDDTTAYSSYAIEEIMRCYSATFGDAIRMIDTRQYDSSVLLAKYSVGGIYFEDMFERSTRECAPGIHFFRSINLAKDYII